MGKKLALLFICLAFILQGCEAFKSYYDEAPTDDLTSTEDAEAESEEKAASMVPCSNVSGLVATIIPEMSDVKNSTLPSEGGEVSVLAEKKTDSTTKMTITNGSKQLSFTLQHVSDKNVRVCNVMYEACDGECFAVKSIWSDVEEGAIEIYNLSSADADSVINSGSYSITFAESNMGERGISISGSYFTDLIGEAFVE